MGARRFAEALGLLVKTNRVDAKILARSERLEGLKATTPLRLALAQLQDLVLARRRFVYESATLRQREQELESKAASPCPPVSAWSPTHFQPFMDITLAFQRGCSFLIGKDCEVHRSSSAI